MKKILYSIIAIAVLFASCKDDFDNTFADDPTTLPAATYMELEEEQSMALWVELLKYTNMFNTLNLSAEYTCFVPNNEAMNKFLASKSISNVDQLNMDEALLLVRYHTIKGAMYSSVDFKNGLVADSTASGDYLSTQYMEGGIVRVNSESNILSTVPVTNGYIHAIDVVLTPVSETIWGVLETSSEYSIMREAIVYTGLKDRLDSIQIDQKRIKYTLLAVPDNIYTSEGITDISSLISRLGAGNDYTNPNNELYKYTAYHLLSQQVSLSSFADFEVQDTARSRNYNTMAENQLFNVSEVNRVLYINYDKVSNSGAQFISVNKNTKNGVIHTIDNIMEVKVPSASKVQWELTDYSDLAVISFYRKSPGTNTQEVGPGSLDVDLDAVSCYEYLTVPSSKRGWTYLLANKNDAVRTKAKNSDILKLDLGLFGWIEMESPSIIAGKYNVYLDHVNLRANEAEGKLSIIIDGEYVGGVVTTRGKSKTSDSYETKTKVGTVEFTESKKHTLRILAGDARPSEIDCLTFEPIN